MDYGSDFSVSPLTQFYNPPLLPHMPWPNVFLEEDNVTNSWKVLTFSWSVHFMVIRQLEEILLLPPLAEVGSHLLLHSELLCEICNWRRFWSLWNGY